MTDTRRILRLEDEEGDRHASCGLARIMHFELWALSTGNRIAAMATEAEALALVRDLIKVGWDAEELSLGLEADSPSESGDFPPVIEGAALKARAFEYA